MAKKRKKPQKSSGKRIAIVQKVIAKKFKDKKLNTKLKTDLPVKAVHPTISSFPKEVKNSIFYQNPLPSSYLELKKELSFVTVGDIFKELAWVCMELNDYIPEINQFLKYKIDFEKNFLKGEYLFCREILERVEKEICVSLWGIENKLLLWEHLYGLEENKSYLSDINSSGASPFVIHLAQHLSTKAEVRMSFSTYNRKIKEYLRPIERYKNHNIKSYFEYKLNKLMYEYPPNRNAVISLEGNSAIIDRYLTFKDIVQDFWTVSYADENLRRIKNIIKSLSPELKDKTILKFRSVCEETVFITNDDVNQDFINICDTYTSGNYEKTEELSVEAIGKYPTTFEFYDLYCKSLIRCGKPLQTNNQFKEGCFVNQIVENIYNILNKGPETNSSFFKAAKISSQLSSFDFFFQLSCFLAEESGGLTSTDYKMALLRSQIENVKDYELYGSKKCGLLYIQALRDFFRNSATVNFWRAIKFSNDQNGNSEHIETYAPIERVKLYKAHRHKERQQFFEASIIYKDLISGDLGKTIKTVPFKYKQIISDLLHCLIKIDRIDDAVDLCVEKFLENEHLIMTTEIEDLVRSIQNDEVEIDKSKIAYPIVIEVTDPNRSQVFVAYDNFLLCHGVERPSELIDRLREFELSQLVYFLYNICKMEILYKSIFFDGTKDIESERINILRFLSDVDNENVGTYKSEINEITKKQILRKGVQEFDEGKIYVDIEGLTKEASEKISESFDRYLQISKFKIQKLLMLDTSNLDDIESQLKSAYKEVKTSLTGQYGFMAFKDIFFEIRDMFISKQHYGLDSYLSTKIRHGTLDGQLFKPFTANNLTTTKNKDDEFIINEYWDYYYSMFEFFEVDIKIC